MTGQSLIASTWLSIASWFTPTSLFLFVNLVIGTIAVTSRFTSQKKPQQQLQNDDPLAPRQLFRAPSLLERVKSMDFSFYKSPYPEEEQQVYIPQPTQLVYDTVQEDPNPPQLARNPSLLERMKSFNLSFIYRSQQPYQQTETEAIHNSEADANLSADPSRGSELDPGHKPKRSKSETAKSKKKAGTNMKKSVSDRSMKMEKEEDEDTERVEQRRPQTARLERTATIGDGDQSVDAKADDFINKFRQQLKLQRQLSLMRFRDILQGK